MGIAPFRESFVVRAGIPRREEKNGCGGVPTVDISSAVVYYGEPSRIKTGYEGVAGLLSCKQPRFVCGLTAESGAFHESVSGALLCLYG